MSTQTISLQNTTVSESAWIKNARSLGYRIQSTLAPSKKKTFSLVTGDAFTSELGGEVGRALSLRMDPLSHGFMRQTLRPGDCVLDIGANTGLSTIIAARSVGSEGRVYAFEPFGTAANQLRDNLAQNGINNVGIFRKAVLDSVGRRPLAVAHDSARNSFSRNAHPGQKIENWYPVETITLDSFISRTGASRIRLINIDVEGAAGLVINGGAGALSGEQAPLLSIRLSDATLSGFQSSTGAVFDKLQTLGYRMYTMSELPGFGRRIALAHAESNTSTADTTYIAAKACHGVRVG
jgi:FkbM family methyltransferase